MATLNDYPALRALKADLDRLEARERIEEGMQAARQRREGVAPGVRLVEVPWAGRWWLTAPQQAVVALLAEARQSRNPDVEEQTLARAAGLPGQKMRQVFAGVPGWDRLVVPGSRPACFRLAPPPSLEDAGQS